MISSGPEMLGDGDGAERLERLDGDGKPVGGPGARYSSAAGRTTAVGDNPLATISVTSDRQEHAEIGDRAGGLAAVEAQGGGGSVSRSKRRAAVTPSSARTLHSLALRCIGPLDLRPTPPPSLTPPVLGRARHVPGRDSNPDGLKDS